MKVFNSLYNSIENIPIQLSRRNCNSRGQSLPAEVIHIPLIPNRASGSVSLLGESPPLGITE
jgi:hypothetical protein